MGGTHGARAWAPAPAWLQGRGALRQGCAPAALQQTYHGPGPCSRRQERPGSALLPAAASCCVVPSLSSARPCMPRPCSLPEDPGGPPGADPGHHRPQVLAHHAGKLRAVVSPTEAPLRCARPQRIPMCSQAAGTCLPGEARPESLHAMSPPETLALHPAPAAGRWRTWSTSSLCPPTTASCSTTWWPSSGEAAAGPCRQVPKQAPTRAVPVWARALPFW